MYPFNPEAVKPSPSDPLLNEEGGEDDDEEDVQGHTLFIAEEEALYQRRFEEGFDMFDERYMEWLALNYPDAEIEHNTLYPHLEDQQFDDLEYMLSLADNLVNFCDGSNPTDASTVESLTEIKYTMYLFLN